MTGFSFLVGLLFCLPVSPTPCKEPDDVAVYPFPDGSSLIKTLQLTSPKGVPFMPVMRATYCQIIVGDWQVLALTDSFTK
jgi:hypothetical protein